MLKLRNKLQALEKAAKSGAATDADAKAEQDKAAGDKAKLQSIAQIIYSENRVSKKMSLILPKDLLLFRKFTLTGL